MFKKSKPIAPVKPVAVAPKSRFEIRVNSSVVKIVYAGADDTKVLTEMATLCCQMWPILSDAKSLYLSFILSDDSKAEDVIVSFNR